MCVARFLTTLRFPRCCEKQRRHPRAVLFGQGGKREAYTRLLRLVEELATENETAIFRRPVTLMCDFEAPFIDAVKALYGSVLVKCCFFHFTKNIRTEAQPIVKSIERAVGKTSDGVISFGRDFFRRGTFRRDFSFFSSEFSWFIPSISNVLHRLFLQSLRFFSILIAYLMDHNPHPTKRVCRDAFGVEYLGELNGHLIHSLIYFVTHRLKRLRNCHSFEEGKGLDNFINLRAFQHK